MATNKKTNKKTAKAKKVNADTELATSATVMTTEAPETEDIAAQVTQDDAKDAIQDVTKDAIEDTTEETPSVETATEVNDDAPGETVVASETEGETDGQETPNDEAERKPEPKPVMKKPKKKAQIKLNDIFRGNYMFGQIFDY